MDFVLIKNAENADFITIKAVRHIKEADLLITEFFISEKLSSYFHSDCKILNANEYKNYFIDIKQHSPKKIVYLTGDNSLNKTEEAKKTNYFRNLGYKITVLPGISEINRITGQNHFPLTIRHRNESFWVYDGKAGTHLHAVEKFKQIAATATTIIIRNPLDQIYSLLSLINQYRNPDTPVLLSTKQNRAIHCTLKDLLKKKAEINLYQMIVINPSSKDFPSIEFSYQSPLNSNLATG
jgi:uroporphyrin-III C-methyltransferase